MPAWLSTPGLDPGHLQGHPDPIGVPADILVSDAVILEVEAVSAVIPAHEAQLLTYLRMNRFRVGLLLNFHALRLIDGLRRFVV